MRFLNWLNSGSFAKQFFRGYGFGAAVAIALFILSSLVHCSVGKQKPNSFGAITYTDNPYMYVAVNIVSEVHNVDNNLSLRYNPLGTYMLYDENVLLCGTPVDKFEGVGATFLMTVERVSHRSVAGVGCHTLVKVNTIVEKKGLQ